MTRIYKAIDTLWSYMQFQDKLKPSDLIMVLCSNDLRVAEYATELYHKGLAPKVLFSGGEGRFTENLFSHTEAETFAKIARDNGVPSEAIILEKEATNTGENITKSFALLERTDEIPQRIIIVQKPFMERRSYATFMKQWSETTEYLAITSQGGSFIDYLSDDMPIDLVIEALVADFERIRDYPAKGFQIEQEMPDDVMNAYETVKGLGFSYSD